MAAYDATAVSGAGQAGHDLRRRNVAQGGSNGNITHSPAEIDDKKSQQVCPKELFLPLWDPIPSIGRVEALWLVTELCMTTAVKGAPAAVDTVNTRRIRIHYCSSHLHHSLFLHTNVQNRAIAYCDLGRSTVSGISGL